MQAGDWIHTREFATLLGTGISEGAIREMCKRGQLTCVPLGCPGSKRPRWFVRRDALESLLGKA